MTYAPPSSRWTKDASYQRCRRCGSAWPMREIPNLHVQRGAVPRLENLCHGPYELVDEYHDGETGAELERVRSLGG